MYSHFYIHQKGRFFLGTVSRFAMGCGFSQGKTHEVKVHDRYRVEQEEAVDQAPAVGAASENKGDNSYTDIGNVSRQQRMNRH